MTKSSGDGLGVGHFNEVDTVDDIYIYIIIYKSYKIHTVYRTNNWMAKNQ